MHLYDVTFDDARLGYRRTLGEAHGLAKNLTAASTRSQVRITQSDYPINHQTVSDLFNGIKPQGSPLRQWYLSRRGALRELPSVGAKPPIFDKE